VGKSTAAESDFRTKTVYGLLCDGRSRGDIVQFCADTWGLKDRQADTYIAKARTLIEEDCRLSRTAFLAESLAGIRRIRQKAEEHNNHGVALACIRLQAELTGLAKQ